MTTAEKLVRVLRTKNMTCVTAELFTEGGVGSEIASVLGASAVYRGGIVGYDAVASDLMYTHKDMLRTHGAASSECVAELSEIVRKNRLFANGESADLSVVIVGADRGSERGDGVVWFGLASKSGAIAEEKVFTGDREAIRAATIEHALNLLLAAAGCDVTDETGIKWEYIVHGDEGTIRKCILPDGVLRDVEIPTELDGKPVTNIGDCAFENCGTIRSVTIPDSVRNIGDSAFSKCDALTSVRIPDGVIEIGFGCFSYCKNLDSVQLPRNLKRLPGHAFFYCDNLSVEVPEGVLEVEDFDTFNNAKKVVLPRSLRKIGEMYFVHGKKYAYSSVPKTEFIWMGSPGRIEGTQDGINAVDAYDKERGHVPEVSFAKSPLYKEAREIAAVLSDGKASLERRVLAWKQMMRSDFSIPCPSSPRRVTLPDVLIDHPFGRYWCCARKIAGYKDLSGSVPAVFAADTNMYEANSVLWKKWEAVISAIERDKPGKALLELSVNGTKIQKRLIVHALNKGAVNFLRAFYGKCPKAMQTELPTQTLFFYLVSSCKMPDALEHIRMLAEISPNLIRDVVDARDNTALWYTLYREADAGQVWPSTFAADNELAATLIELGCDPDRKNMLGLSWADIVKEK